MCRQLILMRANVNIQKGEMRRYYPSYTAKDQKKTFQTEKEKEKKTAIK